MNGVEDSRTVSSTPRTERTVEPEPLLMAEDVRVFFRSGRDVVRAVDGVCLDVRPREIVGLVGESGCGKSTLARAAVQLVALAGGRILLDGTDITRCAPREQRVLRRAAQMVFQDPYASLNPRMTVSDALAEPVRFYRGLRGPALEAEVSRLMDSVGLARRFVRKYPHEFSGGQRQRIAIARALSVEPRILLADEPVSALDVSIQAQILNLLAGLSRSMGLAMLFISHDLSVVRYVCSRVYVMYRGRIVEEGRCEAVLETPLHPYTRALVAAIPLPDPSRALRTPPLKSDAPSAAALDQGCRFRDRCPMAVDDCAATDPKLKHASQDPTRRVACIRVQHSDAIRPRA